MAILIDGYNLLHVTGIVGRGIGPGTLERARRGLLGFLAASLEEDELRSTIVVFDARDAPPGLPSCQQYQGITVRYAVGYEDADDLLKELIRLDSAPRSLVVVSSDHELQRAARRRRATAIDSEQWYAQIWQRRLAAEPNLPTETRPLLPLSEAEVRLWLQEFGLADDALAKAVVSSSSTHSSSISSSSAEAAEKEVSDLANPFPPGYAEDLLEED